MGRLTQEAIFVRLPTELKNRLGIQANRLGSSEATLIRMALVKFIEMEENEQKKNKI